MSFYAVNSCMTTIQVKLQDTPSTQMAPSGPSHVVPLISHCFSDPFLDFMLSECSQCVLTCVWHWGSMVRFTEDLAFILSPIFLLRASPQQAIPRWLSSNPLPANSEDPGDMGWISELGRSPGGENGNLYQYSCLNKSTGRGAWSIAQGLQRAFTVPLFLF